MPIWLILSWIQLFTLFMVLNVFVTTFKQKSSINLYKTFCSNFLKSNRCFHLLKNIIINHYQHCQQLKNSIQKHSNTSFIQLLQLFDYNIFHFAHFYSIPCITSDSTIQILNVWILHFQYWFLCSQIFYF